ncbi:AarF/ABC1/UbiB kinase family protein [Candidatus Woesearchaeota archaeon]|nr:AarF/ABC1/UbiB kinase family protein [Candidatus Woesearchaeota archaeon]
MTIYELFKNRKHRSRIKEMIQIFFEEEFGYLIAKIDMHHHLPFKKRIKAYVSKERLINPEVRLRQAFERLGPTFIKFGQLLSLRPVLIPQSYVDEFEKMQDKAPLFPFSKAKAIIEEELGRPLNKVFASFSEKPIASASISQVYKAKINGKDVAVKVQRPGIKEIIEEDIELMYVLADLLEKEIPTLKDFRLKTIIHEFEKWTLKEINFNIEAYYAKKIADNFKNSKVLKVPKIYDEYTTNKLLVMEFLDGIPLHNISEIKKRKINLAQVIRNGYYIILKQVFVDGFFHADPHPGNLLVMKNGQIGMIDFGILGHFDKKLKRYALDLFQAFIKSSPDDAVNVILRMNPKSDIDANAFRNDIRDIFEQIITTSPDDLEIGSLIKRTLMSAHKHHIEIPADFVLYGKTISIIEGIALRYEPKFKFFTETKKVFKDLFGYDFIAKEVLSRTKDKVSEYQEFIETFPETAKDILDKVKRFKFEINLEDKDVKGLTTELERSSGNLALGMIIAALIIGSSMVMQLDKGKYLYITGFILSGVLGLWLVHRTIFITVKR